jgi:hypothetical protein
MKFGLNVGREFEKNISQHIRSNCAQTELQQRTARLIVGRTS